MSDNSEFQVIKEMLLAIYLTVLGIAVAGGAILFDIQIVLGLAVLLIVIGLVVMLP